MFRNTIDEVTIYCVGCMLANEMKMNTYKVAILMYYACVQELMQSCNWWSFVATKGKKEKQNC